MTEVAAADIPVALVDRAARELAATNPNSTPEGWAAAARSALAAAFAGCGIRGEEGLRLTWTAGDDREGKHGDDHWDGTDTGWARQAVAYHLAEIEKHPGWRVRPTLLHRLIITTPTQERKTDG